MAHHPLPEVEAELITEALPCAHCGYDLRGLRRNARCPECGNAIRAPRSIHLPLSEMPINIVRLVRTRCLAGALGGAVAIGVFMFGSVIPSLAPFTPLLAAAIWFTGAFMLMRPIHHPAAAMYGFSPAGRLRIWAAWLQTSWIVAGAATTAFLIIPGTTSLHFSLLTISLVATVIGQAGIVVISLALENLSNWARDDFAEKCFNLCAFGLPTAFFFAVIFPMIILLPMVPLLAGILWLVAACAFPVGLISISRSADLSVLHAIEHAERDERRRERERKRSEEAIRAIEAADRANEAAESARHLREAREKRRP